MRSLCSPVICKKITPVLQASFFFFDIEVSFLFSAGEGRGGSVTRDRTLYFTTC